MSLITNVFIVMAFDSNHEFADEQYEIEYDKHKLKLKAKQGIVHNLITQCLSRRNDQRKAYTAILSFLGELSWLYKMKINLLGLSASIQAPTEVGSWIDQTSYKRTGKTVLMNLQVTENDIQKLALGIYREALSSNSFFYSYFCYCKIIEILNPGRKKFSTWIIQNLSTIEESDSKFVLNDLSENKKVGNIGEYIYKQGRCAIAHADVSKQSNDEPILKPFDYEDTARVMKEMCLVKELAEIFIYKDLRVPTRKEAIEMWKKQSRKT